MKKLILLASLAAMPLMAMAQHEEDTENGVVSLEIGRASCRERV